MAKELSVASQSLGPGESLLLESGLLETAEPLEWIRPRKGEHYTAIVVGNGSIELPDGRAYGSPSKAAAVAADIPAVDGWTSWRVPRLEKKLDDLRRDLHLTRFGADHDG